MLSTFRLTQRRWTCVGTLTAAIFLTGAVALAAPQRLQAQEHHAHARDDVGTVDFRVSCSEAVRSDFDRAVAMLHHMMYIESRAIFQQIAERDPQCGMAHWGIAMTRFHPLWYRPSTDDLRAGWAALEKAREIGIQSEREAALVAGTEAFFRNPEADEWFPRLARWTEAMRHANEQHSEDNNIAAFYALSEIAAGQAPGEDRMERNTRAAQVLLAVHERQSDHPGALHYTIHANDITGRAGQSLDIVHSYDEVAPSVPHALHMPTHIFVRLGEWPEVIEWNRKSADAALRFPAGDLVSVHYIHALDYMLYAHLQRGEDRDAKAVLDEALGRSKYEDSFVSAFHIAMMPARYAVERREWDEASAIEPRSVAYFSWDRFPWPEALSWFAKGLGAAHSGDLASARDAETRMSALAERARAAGTPDLATYIEVDRLILAGVIANADKNADSAVTLMRAAADLETTVQKHPVTPGSLLPPQEALGDLLMSQSRPAEALAAYEEGLGVWPARYRSLLGAARAAHASGEDARARQYYTKLLDVAGEGNGDRPGLREARVFVASARR